MATEDMGFLRDDFGRTPSLLRRLLYVFFAVEAVAVSTIFFVRIFLIDTSASLVTLSIAALLSAAVLSASYHNLAFAHAARIRRHASPPTKNAFKGNMPRFNAAKQRFESRISGAALWYSCAYNNALFMIITPFLAIYMLRDSISGDLNLLVSGVAAASLALFNSRSALKAIGE